MSLQVAIHNYGSFVSVVLCLPGLRARLMALEASRRTRTQFKLPYNIWYKSYQITQLKCFSSRLAVVFAQARCWVENGDVVESAPRGDAPTTSEWSAILSPTEVWIILEVWRSTPKQLSSPCSMPGEDLSIGLTRHAKSLGLQTHLNVWWKTVKLICHVFRMATQNAGIIVWRNDNSSCGFFVMSPSANISCNVIASGCMPMHLSHRGVLIYSKHNAYTER